MKKLNLLSWMKFNNIKKRKHEMKLMEDYNNGKILQIDKDIDNKEYLKNKDGK